MKLEHFLTSFTKINTMDYRSKWKTRNYKTPRGKQAKHSDINQSRILYDPPPRVMEIKTKIKKNGA